MSWFERLKIWCQDRLFNGAVQSNMWQNDIVRKGERVILGNPKKKTRKPKSKRGNKNVQ